MAPSSPDPDRKPLSPWSRGLLVGRFRTALRISLALLPLFALADLYFARDLIGPLYALKLVQFATFAGALWALRPTRIGQDPTPLAVLVVVVICLTTAAQGNIARDVLTTFMVLACIALGAAALLPWGTTAQAMAAAATTLSMLWNLHHVHGELGGSAGYSAVTMGIAAVASVFIARELSRYREAATRAYDELRSSQQDLQGIFDHLQDVFYRTDLEGRIQMISPSAERFGYRVGDVIGSSTSLFYQNPEDRQRLLADLMEHGSVSDVEIMLKYQDGTPVPSSLSAHLIRDGAGRPVGVEGLLRDIRVRKRQEEQLATLLQVARDVSGTLELTEILERVQRRVAELLSCEAVVTFYLDEDEKAYRIIAQHGIPPERLAPAVAVRFPLGTETGRRLARAETLVVNSLEECPPGAREVMAHFPVTGFVACPLFVRGELLGVLAAFSRSGRHFLPSHTELLESIAGQVAVAIESANLYRKKQEDAGVFSALAEIGQAMMASLSTPELLAHLCELTTEVLGCDFSHTWVRQPEDDTFAAVASHGDPPEQRESLRLLRIPPAMVAGLVTRLQQNEVAEIVTVEPQDLVPTSLIEQFGITVVLCIALRRKGQLIGILAAGYRGREEPFSAQQVRIARGIKEIASVALENARLVEELREADRFRANFVATMSHELRTPLGVITGYIDLLLDGEFGPLGPEQADPLGRVQRNARELLDLVNTTLDLSRMEAKPIPLELGRVDPEEMLEEISGEEEVVADKPGLSLRWNVAPGLPVLYTDRLKLKMILKNLIGNAIKFTEAGQVTVAAARRDAGVEFAVTDTGGGIPLEMREAIFEPFRQGEHQQGGAGLGLYIVRQLLRALGGAITLESEVGQGSTFRVLLPIRRDAGTERRGPSLIDQRAAAAG